MAGFTKGPWEQSHRKKPGGMYSTEVYCSNGETIATLAWYPRYHPDGSIGTDREANARLIATSPEMFEALEVIRRSAGWLLVADETQELVEAVLAKAKGEQS